MKKVLMIIVLLFVAINLMACELEPPIPEPPQDISHLISAELVGMTVKIYMDRQKIRDYLVEQEVVFDFEVVSNEVVVVFIYNMKGNLVAYGNANFVKGNLKEEL